MSTTNASVVSLVASKSLVESLKIAAKVAAKRSTHKELESVRLTFGGNDIAIEATDREVSYCQKVFIPGLGARPFTVMVNRDAILGMKAGVEVSFSPKSFAIGGITYMPTALPEEFPVFPNLSQDKHEETLDMHYFADLLACSTSASVSEVRPILTTVCHRRSAIFATDGLRLCLAEQDTNWVGEFNVPAKHAVLLQKTFGKSGSYLTYDDRYAWYHGNAAWVCVRLQDGYYPDVSRIIPTRAKTISSIADIQPWLAACDAALVVHKQAGKDTKDGNLTVTLTVESSGVGFHAKRDQEFRTQLPVSLLSGDEVKIMCNAQYLKDALQQIGDGATIEFNGNNQPFLLTTARDKLYRRKALVSPVLKR